MKSVVVEASTVAKAIETAWLKAGKPEEFFIRLLQEHRSGFLGFGAVKAKIVFFFKNSHKSDSLFPVVVKQKEYASFFGNSQLKVPTELNSIDHELNKNVSLGSNQQKKKQHNNQSNQQKPKQHSPQPDVRPRPQGELATKTAPHHNEKPVHVDTRSAQSQVVKQVKIQHPVKPQQQQQHAKKNDVAKPVHVQTDKPVQNKPKMQISLQAPEFVKDPIEKKLLVSDIDIKDDVVKNIAKVLKKVQTQKIVANVSRSTDSLYDKSALKAGDSLMKATHSSSRPVDRVKHVTPKFENYDDFINSTTGIPVVKEKEIKEVVVQQSAPIVAPKVETAPVEKIESKSVDAALEKKEVVAHVQTKQVTQAPRVPLKMKRRPLTTDNPGVSGITRSAQVSEAIKTVADVVVDTTSTSNKE